MVCYKCKTEFCWSCLGLYKGYRHEEGQAIYCAMAIWGWICTILMVVLTIGIVTYKLQITVPGLSWLISKVTGVFANIEIPSAYQVTKVATCFIITKIIYVGGFTLDDSLRYRYDNCHLYLLAGAFLLFCLSCVTDFTANVLYMFQFEMATFICCWVFYFSIFICGPMFLFGLALTALVYLATFAQTYIMPHLSEIPYIGYYGSRLFGGILACLATYYGIRYVRRRYFPQKKEADYMVDYAMAEPMRRGAPRRAKTRKVKTD